MIRLLLATFLLLPAVLMAQDITSCSQLTIDLDGDLQIGAGDVLMLLGGYGTDLDVDGDMIPDCQDDCVGVYDTCGVCNGPGPQMLVIDTIIITYDSIYAEAINDWVIYELAIDTLFSLICEELDVFSCGDDMEMDGYSYSTVLIGDQCWFAENLRTTVYANGDSIPAGLADDVWTSTTAGATSVYGEGSSDCDGSFTGLNACDETQSLAEYGRLYNWYAVDDVRGLCPSGWQVPTDGEWTDLKVYITSQGFEGTEGTALKSTYGWAEGYGIDAFGFSAFPGGSRVGHNGSYPSAGVVGKWWSSSPIGGAAWNRSLNRYFSDIFRDSSDPRSGFSVRCLRD